MRGLAGLARRSLEDPQVPISSASIAELFPYGQRTLAGVSVSEDRAYGLSAWYRAVALISGTMAALPLKVYRRGTRERIRSVTVLDSPNPSQTPFEFWQSQFANAISWGNAYGRKLRDGAGVVRQVWVLHPSRVSVDIEDPSDAAPDGKHFTVLNADGTSRRYTSRDIFHMPYLSPHGFVGIPPLRFARQVLGINVATEETAARFYGRGARLDGILTSKQKLDNTQADRLKQRWREKVAGPENAGDIAVLDADTTFTPMALPPQDAQLLESRRFGVVEISRLTGVPPHLLGDVERSTSWGTGIAEQVLGLLKFVFQGWISNWEQRATRELLPGGWDSGSWYAEAALEALLRGDSSARAQFYGSLIQWGILSPNEARGFENLEPVDGLDEYLKPSNMTVVSINGQPVDPASLTSGDNGSGDAGSDTEA